MGRRPAAGAKLRAIDPIADLRRRLGRGPARVTSLSRIRTIVRAWWRDLALADHLPTVRKRLAFTLLEQHLREHKLAGMFVLQDHLAPHLSAADIPRCGRVLEDGHLADWPLVDAFCTRVLATILEPDPGRPDVIYALARWRNADIAWQRAAACIAFTTLAPRGDAAQPGMTDAVLAICSSIIWSVDAIDQTAVGQILRELSRAEPERVETFFIRYARFMTKACARLAVAKLPRPQRAELIAHHKRATTLR